MKLKENNRDEIRNTQSQSVPWYQRFFGCMRCLICCKSTNKQVKSEESNAQTSINIVMQFSEFQSQIGNQIGFVILYNQSEKSNIDKFIEDIKKTEYISDILVLILYSERKLYSFTSMP